MKCPYLPATKFYAQIVEEKFTVGWQTRYEPPECLGDDCMAYARNVFGSRWKCVKVAKDAGVAS